MVAGGRLEIATLSKSLEKKGYVRRERSENDERVVMITLTEEGKNLRGEAVNIPANVGGCIELTKEDAVTLYKILHQMMNNFAE